jgi:hypothetical protein
MAKLRTCSEEQRRNNVSIMNMHMLLVQIRSEYWIFFSFCVFIKIYFLFPNFRMTSMGKYKMCLPYLTIMERQFSSKETNTVLVNALSLGVAAWATL